MRFKRFGALAYRKADFRFASESRADLEALRDMIEDGRIGSIVDSVFPLADAAVAHARVEREERIGAIVLTVNDEVESGGSTPRMEILRGRS